MGETVRRWLVPLGVADHVGAIIALNMPASLSAADRTDRRSIGTPLREDLSTARPEDSLNQPRNVLVGPQYHPQ